MVFWFSLKIIVWRFFLEECRPGSYGSFCSLNCSSYCEKKACGRHSGECFYGCAPGNQKPYCVMRMFLYQTFFALSR